MDLKKQAGREGRPGLSDISNCWSGPILQLTAPASSVMQSVISSSSLAGLHFPSQGIEEGKHLPADFLSVALREDPAVGRKDL